MTEYLFVGGPMHGTTREIEDLRGFLADTVYTTGFEEDPGETAADKEGTYTKRGVYLDFDGRRHLRDFMVWDGEELSLRKVFDAVLRLYFTSGRTIEHVDVFSRLRPSLSPFDGPPGSQHAN